MMKRTLIVSGGFPFRDNFNMKREGFRYEKAFLCEMDVMDGRILRQLEYVSPSDRIGPNFSMQFKFGDIHDGKLFLPTSTEILILDLESWVTNETITHPTFNDLHCVAINNDKLYVVNTGLEIIQIFSLTGELTTEINVGIDPTWQRFDPQKDYRFIATTKPHQTHANYIFFLDGEPWITRFEQRDAVALFDPAKRIDLALAESQGKPHDGLVRGDYIYFTLTDGFVLIVNRRTLKIEQVIDFNKLIPGDLQPGWCRGLEVVDGRLFVGFSQLRKSKFVEYGSWIKHRKKKMPARICVLELKTSSIVAEFPITSNTGAAIFSILYR